MSEKEQPQPMGYYLCVTDVEMKRGGDFIGVEFTSGQVYPFMRFEYKDAVLVNNSGGEHLMPPAMLEKRFRRMPDAYVPEVKGDSV